MAKVIRRSNKSASARETWRSAGTRISCLAFAAAAIELCPAAVASAQTVPPVQVVLNPAICPMQDPYHLSCDFNTPDAEYHVDGTASLFPSLVSNVDIARGPANFGLVSGGRLTYSFVIVGPPSVGAIPILVTASGSVAASGPDAFAFAAWRIAGTPQQQACVPAGNPACATVTAPSFGGTTPELAYPGVVNTIDLLTDAGASVGGSASASVDPAIRIDPSYANASQYQLAFSDGVENVPEPSALWSTACTILGLAALRRAQSLRVGPLEG